ncbi:MAG: DEAD/DEAH box helicase, partial [Rickettsiales bacterium]|nr:DEAD/DEAH box helicase [Rickettsiales bacterium]
MRDESLFFLFSGVNRIKGVGEATAKNLARLLPAATSLAGETMPRVRDLLFHLPVALLDRRFTCSLREAPSGVIATFIVKVDEHIPPARGSRKPYRVLCSNDTGEITLTFFNASPDYVKQVLPEGQQRVISGRTEHFDFHLQMSHPDVIAPVSKLAEVQKPEPVYPLTLGLTSRRIAKYVETALEKIPTLPEWLTPEWRAQHNWPGWKDALTAAHHPEDDDALSPLSPARQRLAYDEMLAGQLHLSLIRRNMKQQSGPVITGTGALTEKLIASLPFTLTNGQREVSEEIAADMRAGKRMGRLLQGDVGSGKTLVALLAMLRAAEHGMQSALMVPTEIIAQQHYETIRKLCEPLGVAVCLLTGNIKGKARAAVLESMSGGECAIAIGTHALFQEQVQFRNLALVVIDEQHRFGVAQRQALTGKGNAPHLLHMTATPIPRSLTLTLY